MVPFAVVVIFLASLARAGAGEMDALKEFKSEDGRFKVLLPGKPETKTQKLPSGPPMKLYVARGGAGVFMVATAEVPEAAKETDDKIQARLDAGRDQGLQDSKGNLLKETRIKLANKYPGREVLIELPGGKEVLRTRFYLVDGRIYQVAVVGTADFVNSAASNKFLDSLNINK
jgi:hypothetical protein